MKRVSSKYKEVMNRHIRNRAFVSVGLGIVNQDAQKDAVVSTECADWGNSSTVFDNNSDTKIYATMEQNFIKTDGSMYFMPEEQELLQERTACMITQDMLGAVRIDLGNIYLIKGLTLDFGHAYPSKLTIETAEKTLYYTNDAEKFVATDVLGETDYIVITPLAMAGGEQRMRIYHVIMGVGLTFSNADVKSISASSSASSISEELPSEKVTLNLYDKKGLFNVDDSNSFIQFMDTQQNVTVSFGIEMDDGSIEWLKYATLLLSEWDSEKGILTINAVDRLSVMEEEYTLGNKIYERTAYEEALCILTDAGLETDQYVLDECLKDVVLNNPMPEASHRECLQLLANACRCILVQDENGRIVIRANFANIIGPEDMEVETNGVANWGDLTNILYGTEYVYAELGVDFVKADGTMYFMPEGEEYLATAYVSEQVADEEGLFTENPMISVTLPASHVYYGVNLQFGGNPPQELIVHTYANEVALKDVVFTDLEPEATLYYDFGAFDQIVIEFVKTKPYNRVLVNKLAFGDYADFRLTKDLMLEQPHGYAEEKIKKVRVKVFTYENDEEGNTQEVEDEVFAERTLNLVGKQKTCENQLVSTMEHAERMAEWLENYYSNNVSYDVDYRGEPRITAGDIFRMESDVVNNLQVEVVSQSLQFDGVFSGSLELRKALKMVKEE